MSWQSIVMYLAVAGLGIPAAFRFRPLGIRNITSLALVVLWLSVELNFRLTGTLPVKISFLADMLVIAAIYAKSITRAAGRIYPSLWQQLRCLIADLTVCDRWIVAIYLFGVWPLYIFIFSSWIGWHGRWALTIIQFMLAGAEAAFSLKHNVKPRAASDPPDSGLAFAGHRRYGR